MLNMTQAEMTPEILKAGVIEPSPENKERIRNILKFEIQGLPKPGKIVFAVNSMVNLFYKEQELRGHLDRVILGGDAPSYLTSALEKAFQFWGIKVFHVVTEKQEPPEEILPDGTVVIGLPVDKIIGFAEVLNR